MRILVFEPILPLPTVAARRLAAVYPSQPPVPSHSSHRDPQSRIGHRVVRAIVETMMPADPPSPPPSASHPTPPPANARNAPSDRSPGIRIALATSVLLIAFVLRAYYVFEIWPHPAARLPILDAEAYRKIALAIRGGDWIGDSVYYLDPLYPFFLAIVYSVVEPDSRAVLLAHALLDSLSVVFVMLIARRVFGDRAALVAGILAATCSIFFFYDGLLQKEALMIFLLGAALHLILRAAEIDRPRAWLPAGLLIGLSALTRGNALLFAPVLVAWITLAGRGTLVRRTASVLLLTSGIAAIILPVAVRNYVVGGDLVLLNSQAGQNFYIGNFRANRSGTYLAPPFLRPNPEVEEADFAAEARRRTGREDLRPSEISSFWLREGLAEIAADPGHFLWHVGKKLLVFANAYEIPDNSSFEYFEQNVAPMLRLPFPSWAAILPLALAGMWMARTNRLAIVLALFFASYTAGLLLFFNLSRMRLPVVPVAIVFAGYAIVELFTRLRARELRSVVVPSMIALAMIAVTRVELPHQPLNIRYFNMGTAFLRQSEVAWAEGTSLRDAGDAEGARAAFRRAFDWRSDAELEFERGLVEFPQFERLRTALRTSLLVRVVALESLDMPGPALDAALVLTARFDRFPMGFVALGRAYERVGERALARAAFGRAMRLDPENRDAVEGWNRLRSPLEPDAGNN